MSSAIIEAAKCCKFENLLSLQALVPSQVDPNSVVPQFKFQKIQRTNVPLLCIAAASDATAIAKYLIQAGADIEKADSV